MRDVVLTPDEIDGLMTGLLVSDNPPLGQIPFSNWLDDSRTSVGRRYTNELRRHFAPPEPQTPDLNSEAQRWLNNA